MSRWSEYDTDAERLPEGFERIGYDADTQVYTFRDAENKLWESAPGNRYGQLRPVTAALHPYGDEEESSAAQPFNGSASIGSPSWRSEVSPLLSWTLLVGLFLLLVFWFISGGASKGGDKLARTCDDDQTPYQIKKDDTCWQIGEDHFVPLETILHANDGLDCDRLVIGETICLPTTI
ncbi:carbohydrate-binding module family 50 protein [Xylariaceae sp. FL1019]|nr:carbohydrate-binding module family 50 protein [Xylariaceae sp. FL1019]